MHKVERLVNLIALLLNARKPLTVDDIRHTVPGYQQEDYASFKRMFERDKEELRTLGIPIERRFTDVWEVEEGYLIPKDRYYLPELDLTPEELAALWIVSGVTVEEGAKGEQALLKLALGTGINADPTAPPWLRARLHLDDPALPVLLEAVAMRRRVKFSHKTPGRSAATQRTVNPYALIQRMGAWYVIGHDQLRDAIRAFKLQNMTSSVSYARKTPGPDFEVPEGFSVEGHRIQEPWLGEDGDGVEVQVAFAPRISWWAEPSLGLQPAGKYGDWNMSTLRVSDEEGFLSWVLGFGEDAVVVGPARLRKEIVGRLQELVRQPAQRKAPARA